jgi:hypothetical protein
MVWGLTSKLNLLVVLPKPLGLCNCFLKLQGLRILTFSTDLPTDFGCISWSKNN